MLKIILDWDTNMCCNKEITMYLHKYQLKRSSTSTKTSASTSTNYDRYILIQFRCSPTQPHSYAAPRRLHAASTPP